MKSDAMRLQKFLSRAGVASRRKAENLMVEGHVRVNGERVMTLGTRIDPSADRVEVDGKEVRLEPFRWILLNKPRGVLTTRRDPGGRSTVYDLLDSRDRRLPYVGRLDRDTEGLLLFANEGDLVHALLHPSSQIPREYRAVVGGVLDQNALAAMEKGVELEDGLARAESVRVLRLLEGGKGSVLSLVLREGRKREVRRLVEAVGHSVRRLRRVRFGPLRLEGVSVGEWRKLTSGEIDSLRAAVDRR